MHISVSTLAFLQDFTVQSLELWVFRCWSFILSSKKLNREIYCGHNQHSIVDLVEGCRDVVQCPGPPPYTPPWVTSCQGSCSPPSQTICPFPCPPLCFNVHLLVHVHIFMMSSSSACFYQSWVLHCGIVALVLGPSHAYSIASSSEYSSGPKPSYK